MRQHKKPCRDCPFRRKSVKGWLGDANPESFITALLITEEPLPCHLKVDYSNPNWKEIFDKSPAGRRCAGSLIMAANLCKIPRDPTVPKMKSDHELVFSRPAEFIEYHTNSLFKSWSENAEVLKARQYMRKLLGLKPIEDNMKKVDS